MSTLDMAAELERVTRLTRLLAPLAVLYEKAVMDACKEPYEINLRVQRRGAHLAENCGVAKTVHFIDGETLQAAYEVWQEYRRIEMELLEQSSAAPKITVLHEEHLDAGERLPDGLNSLSAPERAWLEWFYSLSEVDKNIVEICGEKGISVTPTNFEQMKVIVNDHEAKDSGLNE
jgi:hypothetical protein